jgi:hypothetical protein
MKSPYSAATAAGDRRPNGNDLARATLTGMNF